MPSGFVNVEPSLAYLSPDFGCKPETWNIGGYVVVSAVLGIIMVAEALLLLFVCWSPFSLATNDDALYTFSFLTLLYLAVFSIISARERRRFWTTLPSNSLLAALATVTLIGTLLVLVGIPGLRPLPWWQMVAVFIYSMVSSLLVNDTVKVAMIRWYVPSK